MPTQVAPVITCGCGCGRRGHHEGRGLVEACWAREKRAGTLNQHPRRAAPSAPRPMRLAWTSARGRLEDYTELTRTHGVTPAEAADRLGVSLRTALRYEAHLRATTEGAAA